MMRRTCIIVGVAAIALAACREAEQLPNPFTDGGVTVTVPDAGGPGDPCPCQAGLTAVNISGGCVCRVPCEPSAAPPRCDGWQVCLTISVGLPDGGSQPLDAGVCEPAAGPSQPCAPPLCAETLQCAHIAQQDAGNTCRYACVYTGDASIEDALGADATPSTGHCPPGQRCFGMPNDGGACFVP